MHVNIRHDPGTQVFLELLTPREVSSTCLGDPLTSCCHGPLYLKGWTPGHLLLPSIPCPKRPFASPNSAM